MAANVLAFPPELLVESRSADLEYPKLKNIICAGLTVREPSVLYPSRDSRIMQHCNPPTNIMNVCMRSKIELAYLVSPLEMPTHTT